ncbi:carbonic anhydrase [Sulfurimonas sp.]|uniref:carbonic anhydrase n=1 Tax=Sulfurimonas sp. TaxID=2022749 RepID=UPI002617268E|nr:carbonic anhydrase [Sulfurimonas sp.]
MNMAEYAEGNKLFKTYFKKNKESLLNLVENGQAPKALFIGCSDSRVIPDMIIQSNPGDLFVIRNVGNFVPPFSPDEDFHSTASGIEYAVSILNVGEIIICGHTHCGACQHLFEDIDDTPNLIHTKKWLELGESAKKSAILSLGINAPQEELLRLTEKLSVIKQIENILTYPNVKERFEANDLHIHGWYYDVETGNIEYYDADTYEFLPLKTLISHSDKS